MEYQYSWNQHLCSMKLYFFCQCKINVIVSISFFRCLNKMCFLQIQGVQVCGIKRVIIQTTDFLQIKAYTVKKANVFSFALCGLIYDTVSFDFWLISFSDISPQKVNSINTMLQNKRTKSGICHCYSRLLSELSPLSWCLAFDKDCWIWRQSENKKIKKNQECLLLIWLQNIARLWEYTSFHTLFPE